MSEDHELYHPSADMLTKVEVLVNHGKNRITIGNHIKPPLPRETVCYLATTDSILKLNLIEALKLQKALADIIRAELNK